MAVKRVYSEREKGEALAILDACGRNFSQAARESGVPRATLQLWSQGKHTPGDVPEIRQEKKNDLYDLWKTLVDKALALAPEKIHEAGFDSLIRAAGIGTDKMNNLRDRELEEGGDDESDDGDEYKPEQIEAWAKLLRADSV